MPFILGSWRLVARPMLLQYLEGVEKLDHYAKNSRGQTSGHDFFLDDYIGFCIAILVGSLRASKTRITLGQVQHVVVIQKSTPRGNGKKYLFVSKNARYSSSSAVKLPSIQV